MSKINFLPPWAETNLQPAFYDVESGTSLQQTARMYNKVNELVRTANTQNEIIADYIEQFNELHDYVYDYFDNLDVQEEVNKKLDEMAESGDLGDLMARYIQPQFDTLSQTVNESLNNMMTLVEATNSATPTPVGSTDDMTDHTKTYLLTTDGYWYYWNGEEWTRGGVYQATVIENGSITPDKVSFHERTDNLIDVENLNNVNLYIDSVGGTYKLLSGSDANTLYVPITAGKSYTFIRGNTIPNRAIIGFTATTPANDVQVLDRTSMTIDSSMYKTLTAPSGANYAVFFYQRGSVTNPYSLAQLPEFLCIKEGTNNTFVSSYKLSIDGDDIVDESIKAEKFDSSMSKNSRNLFDPSNANIGNLSSSGGVLVYESVKRSIYIPCEPNTTYTILKTVQSARFAVSTTAVTPADGVSVLQNKTDNSATKITITTASTANYINVYFYHSAHDTQDPVTIMNSICITEGNNDSFVPYGKILSVDTDNYNDGSITLSKLSEGVRGSIVGMTPIQSRSKIYGVKFDLTSNSTKGVRIGDACDLTNDYIVGSNYQLNGGVNDFDNVFPWSDIRRCNLKIQDGKKVITYDDEDDFALDGSNGDVMVEIPKFYSYRKRIGDYETWAISGEPKSEFIVEPAFVVDGVEQDYIYVSAYEASAKTNNTFSTSGKTPKTGYTKVQYINDFESTGMQSYDITTFMMIQKLMVIEFADRNLQNYMGGVTYLPYYYVGSVANTITAIDTNKITVPYDSRKSALWVGERIKLLNSTSGEGGENYARYIEDIEISGDDVTITYSGSDLSGTINIGDGFGGCPQKTGLCDNLDYHTGRTTYATGNSYENFVNPFRYRYMENIYGNVWKNIAGFRLMNLNYYLNYEPDYNASVQSASSDYFSPSYKAPLQDQLGENGAGYIVSCGYDNLNHNIMLPTLCGVANGGGANKYFADAFYSKNESATTEYDATVGGGWDHYEMSGVFCLRAWNAIDLSGGLTGGRIIYRG